MFEPIINYDNLSFSEIWFHTTKSTKCQVRTLVDRKISFIHSPFSFVVFFISFFQKGSPIDFILKPVTLILLLTNFSSEVFGRPALSNTYNLTFSRIQCTKDQLNTHQDNSPRSRKRTETCEIFLKPFRILGAIVAIPPPGIQSPGFRMWQGCHDSS